MAVALMRVSGVRPLRLDLEDHEADLMRSLLGEMSMLLDADVPSEDAVRRRLFPRAYEDEPDERAYRDLIGGDLEQEKRDAVRIAREALGPSGPASVDLDHDALGAWLRLLTDLRLAIGTRLEITEDIMAGEVDPADPDAPALSVLHWLGWIQESLLERAPGEGDDDGS